MPAWQDEFPQQEGLIYLNHAGTAPWPRRAARAAQDFALENMQCGARDYPRWMEREALLREQCRVLLNAPAADDIALLKNTSEALSIVAHGLDWRAGDNIVSTDLEFPSNRIVWESLREQGVELRRAAVMSAADPEQALLDLMDDKTRLLTVSFVQYQSGLRLDLVKLGEHCRRRGVLFCIDAIQGLGALSLDVQKTQADFVMADGHKWLLSAEGLALFYCRREQRDTLRLRQYGWRMVEKYLDFEHTDWRPADSARRFECGSPNMLGIHILSASLSLFAEIGMEEVTQRILDNSAWLLERLGNTPGVEILSATETGRYAGIVTFRRRGVDSQELYRHLMQEGVICAPRGGGVRFAPHFYTPRADLEKALSMALNYS